MYFKAMSEVNSKFPNFLGIGAMRSGTSWLFALLGSHPEVFVPNDVKEVHFFDRYYNKGMPWYLSFFPSNSAAATYKVAGEVTPMYLYSEAVPARVRKHLPDAKFVVLLRNPVDRAYSHYKLAFHEGFTKAASFSCFLQEESTAFPRGLYARQLKRWFDHFPRERFLILIFEEVVCDPAKAMASIASFLGINRQGFDERLLTQVVNPSKSHKLGKLYNYGIKLSVCFRKNDLNWAAHFVARTGSRMFKFLGESKRTAPPLKESVRERLLDAYKKNTVELEKMLKRDLSLWQI